MLISHVGRFIYIKTNKTASTSIEMALQHWCLDDPSAPVLERTHAQVSSQGIVGQRLIKSADATELDQTWFNHMTAYDIKSKIPAETWAEYTKIHAIRDPFDKVLSSFFWKSSLLGAQFDDFGEAKRAFETYAKAAKYQTDHGLVHIDGEYCGDRVIRFEHLREDLIAAISACGLNPENIQLPHTKKTSNSRMGRPLAEFYTPAAIDAVLLECAWIFDRFGYASQPATS